MNGLIHVANGWAAAASELIWRATWQGGLFVIAVWAICHTLKRLPAWARHWLWWIACMQMGARLFIAQPIALPLLPAVDVPAQPAYAYEETADYEVAPLEAVQVSPPDERPSLALCLMSVWALGALALAAAGVRRLMSTRSLLENAALVSDASAHSILADLSGELGLPAPELLESTDARCPMLTGWLKPRVILPLSFSDSVGAQELRMALAHELAHLKRRDLWWATLPAAVKIPFFFHPLAWLAEHEASAAAEESCDALALRTSGGSPAAYARLLVGSAQAGTPYAALGTAFGYRLLRRRIHMLNRTIRSARPLSTRACALLIASAAVFALPWSVTAQATKKATKAKPAVTAKRKHAAKRKKATHKTIRWSSAGSGNGPVVWVTATDKSGSKTQEFTVRTAPAATQSYTVVASGRGGDHPIAYSVTSTPAAKEYTVVTAGKGQSGATQAYSFSSSASSSAPKVVTLTGGKTIVLSGTAPTPMAWSTGDRPRALEFADPAPVAQGGWAESKAGRELSFTSKTVSPEAIWTPGSAGRAIVVMDEPRVSVTSGSGADAKLTVDFEGRDIQSALSQVFRAAKVDFSIRSDVASDKVTVKLTDATLESIVNTILGSVRQPLMFRVEGGVYKIVPRD